MNDIESPGSPTEEILRELNTALDSMEVHLRRFPASEGDMPRVVELFLRLRRFRREIDMRVAARQQLRPPL